MHLLSTVRLVASAHDCSSLCTPESGPTAVQYRTNAALMPCSVGKTAKVGNQAGLEFLVTHAFQVLCHHVGPVIQYRAGFTSHIYHADCPCKHRHIAAMVRLIPCSGATTPRQMRMVQQWPQLLERPASSRSQIAVVALSRVNQV